MSARNILKAVGTMLLALPLNAFADYALNMTEGVTTVSKQIYDLHMLVLWVCVVAGVLTFAVMIYSIINHRKSKHPVPATFHESTTVEIIWTTIPLLVLIAIAVPATKTLLDLEDANEADMTVQITAYQWKWKYDYLGEDVSFFSNLAQSSRDASLKGDPTGVENYMLDVDKPIVLPIKKKIRFVVGSNDVNHAWFVPALGIKQDTIPGFINDTWAYIEKEGTYRGQCAELCGKDHGYMPIVVIAKNEKDYQTWLDEKRAEAEAAKNSAGREWALEELVKKGEGVYKASCSACHMPEGTGLPGVFPALKGSAIATGDIAAHMDIVMNGSKKNPAMAAWAGQLNDVDLAAVITYERNAFGNNKGDLVQPSAIAAARK